MIRWVRLRVLALRAARDLRDFWVWFVVLVGGCGWVLGWWGGLLVPLLRVVEVGCLAIRSIVGSSCVHRAESCLISEQCGLGDIF